jgi:hypothetical protein
MTSWRRINKYGERQSAIKFSLTRDPMPRNIVEKQNI